MHYQLLALDLDGTLLDSSGRPHPENLEAIARAREAGCMVVLCTGRGLTESSRVIEAIGHTGPLVLASGAMVYDTSSHETLHRGVIEPHLGIEIVNFLRNDRDAILMLPDPAAVPFDYYVVDGDLLTSNTRWWFDWVGARVQHFSEITPDDLHHVLRVGLVGPPPDLESTTARIIEQFGEHVYCHHFAALQEPDGSTVNILEIFAKGVNKWTGLQWLAARHDIDESAIACIGDQINDLAMIEHAACGVAMGNAVESVKALANHVTHDNDTAGVAHAIRQMLSGHW